LALVLMLAFLAARRQVDILSLRRLASFIFQGQKMKLVISTTTVNALNTKVKDEALALGASADLINQLTGTAEITHLKNMRIECVGDQWEYEINDEAMFKVLRMYIRVARFIAPLISSIVGLVSSLKDDSEELDTFFSETK
jgi:hypothetical protein